MWWRKPSSDARDPPCTAPVLVDLHCHYLPGVDDGARTLDEALSLARAASRNGIRAAVLTPHVFPGRWDNALPAIAPVFSSFVDRVASEGIPIRFHLGGEVRVSPESFEMLDAGTVPFIGRYGTASVMLAELPDGHIPVGTAHAMRFLYRRGIVPLIAHPERNKDIMRDPARLKPLLDEGCLAQITAGSVVGAFGAAARDAALRLLDLGWVYAIATDAHNLAHRPPMLQEARAAIAQRYGGEAATALTITNPAALLEADSSA